MSGFLDRVLEEKAQEIKEKKKTFSEADLLRRAEAHPVRDFRSALIGGQRIISEIKRRSPNVAAFPQQRTPGELAALYERNGAAAISIVTDPRHFGTSLADLERVRGRVNLPVLNKDFVLDTLQVLEARAAGADAILFITRILSPEALRSLLAFAGGLGMAALVECHDEAEIARALEAGSDLIGINNRDLGTLEVSLETTRRCAPLIPEGALCVAESGIQTRDEILALASIGVDAFLVGGALLQAADPGEKLRELLGRGRTESAGGER